MSGDKKRSRSSKNFSKAWMVPCDTRCVRYGEKVGTPLPKSLVEKIKVMEKIQKFNFPGDWEIMAQEKCIT
jgi:hypothetical protein